MVYYTKSLPKFEDDVPFPKVGYVSSLEGDPHKTAVRCRKIIPHGVSNSKRAFFPHVS